MKIIDLSQVVSETSLIYPGDTEAGGGFQLEETESMEKGGQVNGEAIKAGVHVLTHLDSPGHQVRDGKMVQDYPLEKFVQQTLLIKLIDKKEIKKEDLKNYKDKIKNVGALLIRTGFDKIIERYEKDADFRQKTKISVNDLPRFTQDCAEWLSSFGNLELVGVDSLTVGNKIVHNAFLQKDILLVEGLFLEKAPENFVLHCFPWKLKNVNGAPCRAIAII
jgi:kynurenine formamidase